MIIKVFKSKKGEPQFLALVYFFYSVSTLSLLVMWILPREEPNFYVEAFSEFTMLIFSIGLGWLIMTDTPTINFVRARKKLMKLFILSIVFAVVISMQLLPHGIGRFAGIIQTNPYRIEQAFPGIKVISNKALWSQDIVWVEKDGMYESQDRLILILENNDGVFVKRVIEEEMSEVFTIKKTSDTYYIPKINIEGLYINMPGNFPKGEDN